MALANPSFEGLPQAMCLHPRAVQRAPPLHRRGCADDGSVWRRPAELYAELAKN